MTELTDLIGATIAGVGLNANGQEIVIAEKDDKEYELWADCFGEVSVSDIDDQWTGRQTYPVLAE